MSGKTPPIRRKLVILRIPPIRPSADPPSADPFLCKILMRRAICRPKLPSTEPQELRRSDIAQNAFAIGARPTIADISMMAYLHYPSRETGYDFAASHPAIASWLKRMAALPGWTSAYDLLPGKRLTYYAAPF